MTTLQLVDKILDDLGMQGNVGASETVYRQLLLFLADSADGYGPDPRTELDRYGARAFAEDQGYFLLPCVVCGRWFGGHEKPTGTLRINQVEGRITCNDETCRKEVERINALFPNGLSPRTDLPLREESGL